MRVSLIPSIDMIREKDLKNKTVVIIDVLRATSVITTALANGAKAVLPIVEVQQALQLKLQPQKKSDGILLGGERKAMKIEGFDLSNSPLEYVNSIVESKTIVLSTTNGTKAIHCAIDAEAEQILVGCMLNAKALASSICIEKNNKEVDVAVLCAGTYGNFSLDDYICAGKILYECEKMNSNMKLDDFSKTALIAYKTNKQDILKYVSHASHYEYLMSIGLEEDIKYCFSEDKFDIVPRIVLEQKSEEISIVL